MPHGGIDTEMNAHHDWDIHSKISVTAKNTMMDRSIPPGQNSDTFEEVRSYLLENAGNCGTYHAPLMHLLLFY